MDRRAFLTTILGASAAAKICAQELPVTPEIIDYYAIISKGCRVGKFAGIQTPPSSPAWVSDYHQTWLQSTDGVID